jgi:hypothetical protein
VNKVQKPAKASNTTPYQYAKKNDSPKAELQGFAAAFMTIEGYIPLVSTLYLTRFYSLTEIRWTGLPQPPTSIRVVKPKWRGSGPKSPGL